MWIRWQLLVQIIQRTFRDGPLPEEVTWATMFFLWKVRWGYRGIGLVEVVWKVCVAVVNCQIKQIVDLHDALHGFREGREMVTATLEGKLVQQL